MNHGLLIVFLVASCWLYAAILLAMRDWRWNLGRIILFSLCAGVGAWLTVSDRFDMPWVVAASGAFCATVLVPPTVQGLVRTLILKGRARSARAVEWLLFPLVWKRSSSVFGALERIGRLAREAGDLLPQGSVAVLLAGIHRAASRHGFLASQIGATIALCRYHSAVELFREHFGHAGLKPERTLLYTMVVPYAEIGDLSGATRCLRRAEAMRNVAGPFDVRRFIAHLRVYALCGRHHELERLLGRHGEFVGQLPPAYPTLWRGVALIRSGDGTGGTALLLQALARLTPGDVRIRGMVERHLAAASEDATPIELSPDILDDLDELSRLHGRRLAPAAVLAPHARPIMTLALIAAIVCVWFLSELIGSSTNPFTLMRLGANVSALVKSGETWRIVSSVFLHSGWMHILFNAIACYLFGHFVERTAGRRQVFTIFMVAGVAGSLCSALLGEYPMSTGASGGILGLLGAAIVIAVRFRDAFPGRMRRVYIFNFAFIAVMSMASGLVEKQIDNYAHLGGLAAGVVVGAVLMCPSKSRLRGLLLSLVATAMGIVLALSSVDAVSNALSGGYPRRVLPQHDIRAADGTWQMSVPIIWEVAAEAARRGEVAFADGLGARLKIDPVQRQLQSMTFTPAETGAPGDGVEGGEMVTRFSYGRIRGDQRYDLVFECPAEQTAVYAPLFERMALGFRFAPGESSSPEGRITFPPPSP